MLDALQIIRKKDSNLLKNWKLRIAGWNQERHLEFLQNKCTCLDLNEYVSFIGPVLGVEKDKEHRKADAFILASYSEGLPMSVLEAWSYSLPIVMTDQCNLPNGFENKAAIRVTTAPESIAEGLEQLFRMSDTERIKMGQNGFNLVKHEYTWNGIADKTIKLYHWLLEGGNIPSFVYLN